MAGMIDSRLQELCAELDPSLPTALVGHVHVFGARVGAAVLGLAAPGTEEKLRAMLRAAREGEVRHWEVALVDGGVPVTMSFHGHAAGDVVQLVGSSVPEDYHRMTRDLTDAMGELASLHRETSRQREELARQNAELRRLNREIEESNRGVVALLDAAHKLGLLLHRDAEIGVDMDILMRCERTIAKVIRAQPFPPPNSILGPKGERWLPVHGQVPLGQAAAVFGGLQQVFAGLAAEFEQHGVFTGYLFSSLSTNAIVIEPVFYWPDERAPIHESLIEPAHLARLPVLARNDAARALVQKAKAQVIEVFARHGCGHFQIGRTYPYRPSREPASWALLEAFKREVDPQGLMNPGVLGFDTPQGAA